MRDNKCELKKDCDDCMFSWINCNIERKVRIDTRAETYGKSYQLKTCGMAGILASAIREIVDLQSGIIEYMECDSYETNETIERLYDRYNAEFDELMTVYLHLQESGSEIPGNLQN